MRYILLFLLMAVTAAAQDFSIKSLKIYSSGEETSFPVIVKNSEDPQSLTIEFDIKGDIMPNLSIIFRFCDSEWRPYESQFFENRMYNTAYNLEYESVPVSAEGARYHFKGTYPNKDVRFPFSGKYIYDIVDATSGRIYTWGKFYVVDNMLELNASIKKYRIEGRGKSPNNLNRAFDIRTSFTLPEGLYPMRVMSVEMVENLKIDYPVIIDRNSSDQFRFYEWNASDKFTFVARDIFPGNEYRQADITDKGKYKPPVTQAHFEGIETSRFYDYGFRDMNGGSKLVNYKDPYADYMDVVFRLRPGDFDGGDIFITGAFNDWLLLPSYRLKEANGIYTTTVKLKRGVYDYQYVTGSVKGNNVINADWYELEGNFWETNNDYYIFLYYNSEEKGGYDKIIGYVKINSGGL